MRVAIAQNGVSPSLVWYGEQIAIPGAIVAPGRTYEEGDIHQFVRELQNDLQNLSRFILEDDKVQCGEQDPASKREFPYTSVYVADKRLKGAFEPKYSGPYEVLSVDFPVITIASKPVRFWVMANTAVSHTFKGAVSSANASIPGN